jgi:hypothetical protein
VVGVSYNLQYKYLNALYVSAQMAIFKCTNMTAYHKAEPIESRRYEHTEDCLMPKQERKSITYNLKYQTNTLRHVAN